MTETILRVLALLAEGDDAPALSPGQKGRYSPYGRQGLLRRAAPPLRLVTVLWCILLSALSRNAVFTTGILAAGLLRLALLPGRSLIRVLQRVLPPLGFSVLILLPGVFLGHPRTMLTISLKVLTSLLLLALMSIDLSWKEVTASLGALHLPQVLILTLDMTIRFLVLMGRLCQSMYEALTLRTVSAGGRRYDRARMEAAGGILGTVFLRSGEMAAEVTEAMECRCFNGTFRTYEKHRLCGADLVCGLLLPLVTAAFFITGR